MTRIVVLAGDGEYESNRTMHPIADLWRVSTGAEVDYRESDVLEDVPHFPRSTFGALRTALAEADLLVMYTRFRVLDDAELAAIRDYLDAGGNLLALRTSTHAFHPVDGSSSAPWAAGFGERYLGSGWSRHHGHTSTTTVTVTSEHPITAGLPGRFPAASWLYVNTPPAEATLLLWGEPVGSELEDVEPSPVAWTLERASQRVFYTSLGSQDDLEQIEVRALLNNAAQWCLAPASTP